MRYLILIYENEATTPQDEAEFAKWMAYTESLKAAGVLRGGEALQPTSTATTVRVQDGRMITTDGPFAETKEQLGGFYMIECENLDEALKWAAEIPSAARGPVEVRPIMDFGAEDQPLDAE
ncbi:MAG TPA: YciI family protein [Longimicrobiales bacterium]|nr:YciI family protein [Longimicrobiales bacterium]